MCGGDDAHHPVASADCTRPACMCGCESASTYVRRRQRASPSCVTGYAGQTQRASHPALTAALTYLPATSLRPPTCCHSRWRWAASTLGCFNAHLPKSSDAAQRRGSLHVLGHDVTSWGVGRPTGRPMHARPHAALASKPRTVSGMYTPAHAPSHVAHPELVNIAASCPRSFPLSIRRRLANVFQPLAADPHLTPVLRGHLTPLMRASRLLRCRSAPANRHVVVSFACTALPPPVAILRGCGVKASCAPLAIACPSLLFLTQRRFSAASEYASKCAPLFHHSILKPFQLTPAQGTLFSAFEEDFLEGSSAQ